eukprot:20936-Heterococcus_DN1.PRE.2
MALLLEGDLEILKVSQLLQCELVVVARRQRENYRQPLRMADRSRRRDVSRCARFDVFTKARQSNSRAANAHAIIMMITFCVRH